jgi:DNA (cytosine-5)-methyltransferase 1
MLTTQLILPLERELVIDLFAGGGGASTGIEQALGRSPDCKHFSKAKGGQPVSKKIRGLAWVVVKWAKLAKPRVIHVENVEEFQTWGPLLPNGRVCPDRKGRTFRNWKRALKRLGYAVEHRELRACDYGAPTIRKRLFLTARRDGAPIVWPDRTHGPGLKPWRTAAECIDWTIPCPSIFERERPLAEATMRRIAHGIKRYVLDAAKPFIVPVTHPGDARVHGIDDPFRTITGANRGELALAAPTIARIGQTGGNGGYANRVEEPLTTVTSKAEHLLVSPTLVQTGYGERPGQAPRVPGLDKPLGTCVDGQKHALVAAFLAKHYGGHETPGTPLDKPISTVTTQDHHHLVTSHLAKLRGTSNSAAADAPLGTVSAQGFDHAEVRALLLKYYGTDQDPNLREPLHTVTTKDRFGVVTVKGEEYLIADIGMRMLQPRELYRAQGFPESYVIDRGADGRVLSKAAQVRMCGNSVCPPLARAIVAANYQESLQRTKKAA